MRPFWALLAVAWCVGAGAQEPSAATVRLVAGQNQFAFDLLRAQPADRGTFCSPYSICQALTMLYVGADDGLRAQLAKALGVDAADDGWLRANASQAAELLRTGNRDGGALALANGIFLAPPGEPRPGYAAQARAAVTQTEVRSLDFGRPEEARTAVNQFVAEHTHQRITDLIPRGGVNPSTLVVVANATWFRMPWAKPFDPSQTEPAVFHRLDGTRALVPFMNQVAPIAMGHAADCLLLAKDYRGGQLRALMVLPDEGKLPAVESRLSAAWWAAARAAMASPVERELAMPKFSAALSLDLLTHLRSLGIAEAAPAPVATGRAGGFTTINGAWHRAFVRVDELGTEAAAASGMRADSALPNPIRLNRPFLFVIEDRATGAILFLGRIGNPGGEVIK
ncbi:MAG: hypothetical protein HZB16_02570 [Armatimonadetes bacterium]|nr:hypothetical protein [Armatimonadota bacterium]